MEHPSIIFFTGASGAGKITVLERLAQEIPGENILFERFDACGIPSREEMIKDYGAPQAWQEQTTYF